MSFAQPFWLFSGFALCLGLIFVFHFFAKKRQAALQKFVAHQLIDRLTRNISGNRRLLKNILIIGAVFMCFVALARPQQGSQWVEVRQQGIDLLFALDTSKSMLAEDIKPNRLQRAHLAIQDFVEKLDGDRVGLLPFAGTAYLMCPLTIDYDAFLYSLSVVNTDLIPQGGTNIAAVIDKAVAVLANGANHKILIIVTDGENLQGDALQAAEAAAKQGLTIYTVGVGTSQGELIPLPGGFVKDRAGNFVTSRLDEATLQQIAEKTGGLSVLLGPSGEGLETIYRQKLALIPKEDLAERRHKVPIEKFEWPLALAACLLLGEMLVGERKGSRRLTFPSLAKTLRRKFSRGGKAGVLALLLLVNFTGNGYGSEGEDAYLRGDYLQASEYYRKKLAEKPDDPQLQYNLGTAAYKNNMYDEAIGAFSGALKSDRIELQKKAYYNRGNSYYQKGAEMRQGDPPGAAEKWRQALDSLKSALELDPQDADAKYNQEIVEKQLAELEKQLEKEKKEQPPAEQDKEQQKENDPDKKGQKNPQQNESGSPDSGQQQAEQQQSDKQQADKKQGQDAAKPDEKQPGEQPPGGEDQGDAKEQPTGALEAAGPEESPPEEQANKDAMRRQLGKMTKEEAERLLNGLKNEEGNLNFVPSGHRTNDKDPDRDW
jgi:Ca-activated chloride channel family protein